MGQPKQIEEDETISLVDETSGAKLLVYNDDHNTFDWVIKCFIDVLNHTFEQAEQLSLLIHLKGKAVVKTASKKELLPKKEALIERGLSAVIEEE